MIRNLVLLLEIFTYLFGFAAICERKLKIEIYEVILIIANMVLLVGINENSIPIYLVTLSYVMMCVYCMMKYNVSLKRTVLNFLILSVVIATFQAVCFLMAWIFNVKNEDAVGLREFLASIVQLLIFIFFVQKLRLKELSDFLMKKNVLLSVAGIFLLVILGSEIWKIKSRGFLEASDYVPIIYFVILILVMAYEWQKTKTEAELEKAEMEMNMYYYEAYEGRIQYIRERQHDFKNHINTISGMLYTNADSEEIILKQKEYFQEMMDDLKDTTFLTMIENPPLSGFVIHVVKEAEKHGIKIEQECFFAAQKLKISEYRLVDMFGVLCNNAIEATPKTQHNKTIWIQLWKENNLLWFSVKNCYEGKEIETEIFNMGYSSKGGERGLGLAKLRRMVDENGGKLCVEHGNFEGYKTVKFIMCVPV